MPKEFYTERDIEDLVRQGTKSLRITENIVLTELAYEMANRLGLQLISGEADHPPSAPVRPYLSEVQTRPQKPAVGAAPSAFAPEPGHALTSTQAEPGNEVEARIRSAVIARLGNQVDANLLNNIIHRVVKSVGLK